MAAELLLSTFATCYSLTLSKNSFQNWLVGGVCGGVAPHTPPKISILKYPAFKLFALTARWNPLMLIWFYLCFGVTTPGQYAF